MMAVIIRLQNLPLSANAATIRSFFQGLKIPDGGVNIVGGVDGDAFIAFGTDDDARQAMHLSGQKINGCQIKLLLSSKSEMQSIITTAQKNILKRVAISPPPPAPQQFIENNEKKTISYFNPTSSRDTYDIPPTEKMRIIDHLMDINDYNNESNYDDRNYINKNREIIDQSYKNYDNKEFVDQNFERSYQRSDFFSQDNQYQERRDYENRNYKFIEKKEDFFADKDDNIKFSNANNKENKRFDDPPRPSAFSYNFTQPSVSLNPRIIPTEENIPQFDEYRVNYKKNDINCENMKDFSDNNFRGPDFIDERQTEIFSKEFNDFIDDEDKYGRVLLPTPPRRQCNEFPLQKHENVHHDYSVRPAWLDDADTNSHFVPHNNPVFIAPLKSIALKQASPSIKNKSKQSFCENKLIRTTLPSSIISAKTIFDIFRNISIVSKCGIKMEVDKDKRLTGYVYILLVDTDEAEKALKFHNTIYRDLKICVESLSDNDFNKVYDKNDEFKKDETLPLKERSPYYRDLCIEISNIPLDVKENDLKDYLTISINNKKIHFIQNSISGYCLITADDEIMMENILKFNGVSFSGSILKVLAISKHQLQFFVTNKCKEEKKSVSKPLVALSCVKVDNLNENTKAGDLKRLFLPSNIPLQNIIIKNMECVVDLISCTMCQKVMNDIKRKPAIDYVFTPITSSEFQSIKNKLMNVSIVKSVPNLDKGINRPNTPSGQVRIKNFPVNATTVVIKDFIRNFKYQPRSIRMCYEYGKCTGEAILNFKLSTEAVDFKDAFHGTTFKDKKLEVLLSEN